MPSQSSVAVVLLVLSCSLVAGCGGSPGPLTAGSNAPAIQTRGNGQINFRVRSDFTAALNSNQGWAGALNESVAIHADQPFRVRFEVERPTGVAADESLRLQYRRNASDWLDAEAHDFPYADDDDAETPRVSIVPRRGLRNGSATTDVLSGSAAPFRPGSGIKSRRPNGVMGRRRFAWRI